MLAQMTTGFAFANETEDPSPSSEAVKEVQTVSADEMIDGKRYVKDQLIVTYADDISSKKITKIVNEELDDSSGDAAAVGTASAETSANISDDSKAAVLTFDGTTSKSNMKAAIETLQENEDVTAVQPNYLYSTSEADKSDSTENDDPDYSYQYQFDQMNIKGAWDELSGTGNPTKVAIIDTGCDLSHEDLQENIDSENCKMFSAPEDASSTDDIEYQEGDSYDESGHGTHVTGIIGATYGNGIGVAGAASGYDNNLCKITMYDASDDGENFDSYGIAAALYQVEQDGIQVLNMSLSALVYDKLIVDGVRECYNNGICIITASGNDAIGIGYKPNEDYYFSTPPSLKETLAVNANDSDLNITNYSNYGTFTDVTAPGEEIYSTYQSDGYTPYYDYLSGTSMSAPMVTSVAAMILDANPDLTPAQVYNIICATAQDEVLGDPKGFDKNAGYGLVDAEAAVEAAKSASASVPVTDLILKPGMSSVTIRNGSKFQPEVLILPAESLADVT